MYQNPQNKPAQPTRQGTQPDPFVYAGIVGAFLHDRNPIQMLVGDMQRMISVLINLNKNRHLAQTRITQLQAQVARVESQISDVNPSTVGHRLNRLR